MQRRRVQATMKTAGRPAGRSIPWLVVAGWIFLLAASGAWAASSVNVPLEHWSYAALDKLGGFGLIRSDVQGTRPFTRMEIGRLVNEAMLEAEKRETKPAIVEELFARFRKEFGEELDASGPNPLKPASHFIKPLDEAEVRYVFTDGRPRLFRFADNIRPDLIPQLIDATEGTPLVYNNNGVVYGNYHNLTLQLAASARAYDIFSAYLEPILLLRQNSEGFYGFDSVEADVLRGYGKIAPWKVELEFGRDSMWWGQGRHGSLLLTNNADPLDMIKVSNPIPELLPWVFSYLGPSKFTAFVARLEEDRDFPNPYLGGFRVNFKPHPLFEFGAATTFIFDGEGRPNLTLGDIPRLIGFFGSTANRKVNQLAALDFRLQIPFLWNAELYGEYGGEDAGSDRPEEVIFRDIAFIVGLYFPRITPDGRMDLRVEFANTEYPVDFAHRFFWYGHRIYIDGYTFNDMILGHHVGGDARDVFARTTYYLRSNLVAGLDYDYMARGFRFGRGGLEEIHQIGADLSWDYSDCLTLFARYGFEDVSNFNTVPGQDRQNNLFMTGIKYNF